MLACSIKALGPFTRYYDAVENTGRHFTIKPVFIWHDFKIVSENFLDFQHASDHCLMKMSNFIDLAMPWAAGQFVDSYQSWYYLVAEYASWPDCCYYWYCFTFYDLYLKYQN